MNEQKQEQNTREIIDNLEPIKSLEIKPVPENQKPFNIWHPVNGKWTHLVKTTENEFYTNGKLEKDYSQVM